MGLALPLPRPDRRRRRAHDRHEDAAGEALAGLDEPEQLGEVPHDYRGMLLIEDMYLVGQALER